MDETEMVLDEQIYENIAKILWNGIEYYGIEKSFNFRILTEKDTYEKVKNKIWTLRHHLNDNYLNDHGLHISKCEVITNGNSRFYIDFSIEEVESQKTKKTIEKLEEMITQIYYAPGMPGYISAKEEFEKR